MQWPSIKESKLNPKLLLFAVPVLLAYLIFHITKTGIDNTVFGTLSYTYDGYTFILPTATLTSFVVGIFVYACLKSFLVGVYNNYQMKSEPKLLSRELQIIALTVISIYAAFNLQRELFAADVGGVINVGVTNTFQVFIPTVMISSIALAAMVFFILIEFLASISKEAGKRHSESIQRLATAAMQKPEIDHLIEEING